MPQFEQVSLQEAMQKSAPSKRLRILQDYVGYVEQLQDGQAGKLVPSIGETALTVRRRLSSAAKLVGKQLEIKRAGEEVYFWVKQGQARRRGRLRKSA